MAANANGGVNGRHLFNDAYNGNNPAFSQTNCPGIVAVFDWMSPVARMMGAGFVAHETGVRLGGALLARVVHHLAFLTRPAQGFPRLLIDVAVFRR